MRKLLAVAMVVNVTATLFAAEITFEVGADRPAQFYALGDEAVFSVTCRVDKTTLATSGVVTAVLDNFGTKEMARAQFDLAKTPVFQMRGTMREPGFLRLTLTASSPDKGRRVWSVGFSPENIRRIGPEPADFDAFWQSARAKLAREVPLDPQVTRIASRCTAAFDFYGISFATFGRRVYGFLSVPKGASATHRHPARFSVSAAGLGSWSQNMNGAADEVRVFMTAYDWVPLWNDLAAAKVKFDAMNAAARAKWGVGTYSCTGIAAGREESFFYPLILGCDRVIDWLAARPEVDARHLRYEGTSQGGMMGLILTGFNKRIVRCLVQVPAGCDHLAYTEGRRCGWPQFVAVQSTPAAKAATAKWVPYFDAAVFAARIKCPLYVIFGFSDETCCAPSVWSAYNASPSKEKKIVGGVGMGHNVFGSLSGPANVWLKAEDAQ